MSRHAEMEKAALRGLVVIGVCAVGALTLWNKATFPRPKPSVCRPQRDVLRDYFGKWKHSLHRRADWVIQRGDMVVLGYSEWSAEQQKAFRRTACEALAVLRKAGCPVVVHFFAVPADQRPAQLETAPTPRHGSISSVRPPCPATDTVRTASAE